MTGTGSCAAWRHFAQLANEFLPGGVVLKDVGKGAVGGFFLFNIGFRRGVFAGSRGSGGHAGDRDGERWRTKQANQQQQDPRHGVSGENVEQNDKYRSRDAEGDFGNNLA